MTTRFRVVDHAATGQRYRTVSPASHQYESPARAKIAAELAQGQPGKFDSTFGSIPWSPTGGGADVEGNLLAMAGLPGTPSAFGTHKGRHGFPVPNIFNAIGPGTLLGAVLQMSDAGREFASLMNQRRGGSGGMSQRDPFGVGGRLYGRPTGNEAVSEGGGGGSEGTSGDGRPARMESEGEKDTYTEFAVGVLVAAGFEAVAEGAATWRAASKFVKAGVTHIIAGAAGWGVSKGMSAGGGAGGTSGTEEFDPWSGNLYGRRADGGASGNYPTATPEHSGGHARSTALVLNQLAEALRRWQNQAHMPAGSEAGGGGGTAMAPERLFLHGMKHWYDMVAMHRVA